MIIKLKKKDFTELFKSQNKATNERNKGLIESFIPERIDWDNIDSLELNIPPEISPTIMNILFGIVIQTKELDRIIAVSEKIQYEIKEPTVNPEPKEEKPLTSKEDFDKLTPEMKKAWSVIKDVLNDML